MSAMLELLGHLCRERVLVKVAATSPAEAAGARPTAPRSMSGAVKPPGGWGYRRRRFTNAPSSGAGLSNGPGNIGSATYGVFGR